MARAAAATSRCETRERAPLISAPRSAPAPIVPMSRAYVAAVPWKVKRANSGRTIWKLKASVPTSTVIASGTRRAGVLSTARSPARSWPDSRGATGWACRAPGSIRASATSMNTEGQRVEAEARRDAGGVR